MNRKGMTTFAAAFLDQRIDTEIQHSVMTHTPSGSQDRGTMRLRLRRPTEGHSIGPVTEHRDGFLLASGPSWFDTLQLLRALHDERTGRRFRPSPDGAWEPLLAPWVATKGNWETMQPGELGPDELLEIYQLAHELGFRGLFGWTWWFTDWWSGKCGDYYPRSQFADLRAFIREMKDIGIMTFLWLSPWQVSRGTRIREDLREAVLVMGDPAGQPVATEYLCPRHPITLKYVPELVARVLRDYEPHGFTMDNVDATIVGPCIAEHEHSYSSLGLALADTFAGMRQAVDAIDPNTLIEFRARYSNISNLYNATSHRSIDSGEGGSYDLNRHNCVLLRSYVPPGVAVHTDPVWWDIREKNETVAKMLATMVVSGVPQVGADIVNMTDDHRRLVKTWLSFYHAHKEDFRYGQLRPVQHDAGFSTFKVEHSRKAFVNYASYPALRVPLDRDADEIYLFNCTNEDYLHTFLVNLTGEFTATVHNYDLSPISDIMVEATDGALLVDLNVPQGGYVALRKRERAGAS